MKMHLFFMFLRAAFRALFRRRVRRGAVPTLLESDGPLHPSQLCRCFDRLADAAHDILVRGRLRTLGLVNYPRPGLMRAADLLFPEGAAA